MKIITLTLVLVCGVAVAGTALFTGKHEIVITEDGESGVRCEYEYNGHPFWVTFIGTQSCPSSLNTSD